MELSGGVRGDVTVVLAYQQCNFNVKIVFVEVTL